VLAVACEERWSRKSDYWDEVKVEGGGPDGINGGVERRGE
jgi:hypothetical protein